MVWYGMVRHCTLPTLPILSRPVPSDRLPSSSVEQLRDCVMTAVIVRADLLFVGEHASKIRGDSACSFPFSV